MAETKDMVTGMDTDNLRELAEMFDSEDVGGAPARLPVLKINYEEDCKHAPGVWVVGQEKDQNGELTNDGQAVKGFVVLVVKNRYSLYSQKNPSLNCSSPVFTNERVRGNNHGHICGKSCPYRDKDADPRCKAQKVAYGVALTESGEYVDCVAYFKGASYMPLMDYLDDVTKLRKGSKYVEIPPFCYLTLLDTEKRKAPGSPRPYYVAVLSKGSGFDMTQIRQWDAKRAQVYDYLDYVNKKNEEVTDVDKESEAPHVEATYAPKEETPPWEEETPKGARHVETPGSDDDDIEAALARALA